MQEVRRWKNNKLYPVSQLSPRGVNGTLTNLTQFVQWVG